MRTAPVANGEEYVDTENPDQKPDLKGPDSRQQCEHSDDRPPTLRMVTQNWSRRRRRNSVTRGSSGGVWEIGIPGGCLSGISIAAASNGSRLSCGALVKASFPNLRALSASSTG
jgi:hypothetical protein